MLKLKLQEHGIEKKSKKEKWTKREMRRLLLKRLRETPGEREQRLIEEDEDRTGMRVTREKLPVYVVSLAAFFDRMCGGGHAIKDQINARAKQMIWSRGVQEPGFKYSREDLEEALVGWRGPYGPVGDVESTEFLRPKLKRTAKGGLLMSKKRAQTPGAETSGSDSDAFGDFAYEDEDGNVADDESDSDKAFDWEAAQKAKKKKKKKKGDEDDAPLKNPLVEAWEWIRDRRKRKRARKEAIAQRKREAEDARVQAEKDKAKGSYTVQAAIVQKLVLLPEEAKRRTDEKDRMAMEKEAVEMKMHHYTQSSIARKKFEKQVKEKKLLMRDEQSRLQDLAARFNDKLKDLNDDLRRVNERANALDDGEPFHKHGFRHRGEVEEAIDNLQATIDRVRGKFFDCENKAAALQKDIKGSTNHIIYLLGKEMIAEKVKEARIKLLYKVRKKALRKGWRRPWDGRNGEDFYQWQLRGAHRPDTEPEEDKAGSDASRFSQRTDSDLHESSSSSEESSSDEGSQSQGSQAGSNAGSRRSGSNASEGHPG